MHPVFSKSKDVAAPENFPSGADQKRWRLPGGIPFKRLAIYFLGSRLLILLVAWLSLQVVQKGRYYAAGQTGILDWFNRWDAGWYLHIVKAGYHYDPSARSSVAFFPLYPLLVRLAWTVIPDPRAAGYFVSNGFLLVACIVLWKLVRRDYDSEKLADRAVLFLLFGPVSLFFSSIYSESVFFFFFVATIYFAGGRSWIAAGVCGYLTGLSRHVGVLVAVPVAVTFYYSFKQTCPGGAREWKKWLPMAGCLAMPGAGLAMYCLFLWVKFGEPMAFKKTEIFWGRHPVYFWKYFSFLPHDPFYGPWFLGTILVAVAFLVAGLVLKLKPEHQVIGLLFLLTALSSGQAEALPRFLSVIFPFYISAAMLAVRWPRLEPLMLAATTSLLTLSTILFVNGYWFT